MDVLHFDKSNRFRRVCSFRHGFLRRMLVILLLMCFLPIAGAAAQAHTPSSDQVHSEALESVEETAEGTEHEVEAPAWVWSMPFVLLLGAIAFFPLIPGLRMWWISDLNKLAVSLVLAGVTCCFFFFHGFHDSPPGVSGVLGLLNHAVLEDFVPFIILLFSLYTISGGIHVRMNMPANPLTNAGFLLVGVVLASFIGTTGVAMLLIRPLLMVNRERRHVTHTVVFFIFLVCNVGGCLLPIGDPPLFLGYLRGVPFLWTLSLWKHWALTSGLILAVYVVWDMVMYRREAPEDLAEDNVVRVPFEMMGWRNIFYLVGVVLAVALLVPRRPLPVVGWVLPKIFLREIVLIGLAVVSFRRTHRSVREANDFNFVAIFEVAALFIGIFITMQVPVLILGVRGHELGLHQAWHYFWATGTLSSFLDNAPTYVVYFSTAGSLPTQGHVLLEGVRTASGHIRVDLLQAISCGAVFMGALTYIGNGPNFMVRSIAEQSGVRMPSFFGYILYSVVVLVPVFGIVSWVFFF